MRPYTMIYSIHTSSFILHSLLKQNCISVARNKSRLFWGYLLWRHCRIPIYDMSPSRSL